MNRMKWQFLGVLALGALIGLFISLAGSKSSLLAQDASKATQQTPKTTSPTKTDKDDHAAERAAIGKTTQSFVEALIAALIEQRGDKGFD